MGKRLYLIYGMLATIIIAGLFTLLLYKTRLQVKNIDYPKSILDNTSNSLFYVDNIEDDGKIIKIKGCAQDSDMVYEYHNWVLGSGTGIYQNCDIVLVSEDTSKVYQMKTYFYSLQSTEIQEVDGGIMQQYGIMAQTKKSKIEDGKYKVAVLFQDREENEYLKYPEEDIYVEVE